jgi:hypothetical protein
MKKNHAFTNVVCTLCPYYVTTTMLTRPTRSAAGIAKECDFILLSIDCTILIILFSIYHSPRKTNKLKATIVLFEQQQMN